MEAFQGPERRKYKRLVGSYLVYYKIKGSLENYELSRTKNISRGGMLLTLDKPFKEGTIMIFIIKGPFTHETAIEIAGVVLESREIIKGSVYEARIKFLNPDAKSLDGLDQFIKQKSEDH